MRRSIVILLSMLLVSSAFALDPTPLSKVDAKVILEYMEWKEVTVIAIRQGVDSRGAVAPIYATVIGLGKCRGRHQNICQTFYFDSDLDWHFLELTEKAARVWNKLGLQEVKPWSTW